MLNTQPSAMIPSWQLQVWKVLPSNLSLWSGSSKGIFQTASAAKNISNYINDKRRVYCDLLEAHKNKHHLSCYSGPILKPGILKGEVQGKHQTSLLSAASYYSVCPANP